MKESITLEIKRTISVATDYRITATITSTYNGKYTFTAKITFVDVGIKEFEKDYSGDVELSKLLDHVDDLIPHIDAHHAAQKFLSELTTEEV